MPVVLCAKKLNVRLSSPDDFKSFRASRRQSMKQMDVTNSAALKSNMERKPTKVTGASKEKEFIDQKCDHQDKDSNMKQTDNTSAENPSQSDERIVEFEWTSGHYDEEYLLFILESDRYSGSKDTVEKIYVDENSSSAAVEFMTAEAAFNFQQMQKIEIGKQSLFVKQREAVSQSAKQSSSVVRLAVQGIPQEASVDSLRYCLEAYLGISPYEVIYNIDKTSAVVTFKNEIDIIRMGQKLKLENGYIMLKLLTEPKTVLVSGLKTDISRDYLNLYFESPKTNGGPVSDVKVLQGQGAAEVTFKNHEDVLKVLQHEHVLAGQTLSLRPFYPELGKLSSSSDAIKFDAPELAEPEQTVDHVADEKQNTDNTIEVHGLNSKSCNKDFLELLFENRRKSGGGPISRIDIDEKKNMALITFQNAADAKRVIQKSLIRYDDMCIVPKSHIPPVLDRNRIVVNGLTDEISYHCLVSFLQAKSKKKIEDILFSVDGERALVSFEHPPDFYHLKAVCKAVPLDGAQLNIEQVERSSTIQVHNIGDTEEAFINLYFENPKSWGGAIRHVEMHKQEQYCLVTFEDSSTADTVLAKPSHELGRLIFYVNMFHKEFGILPKGHDPTQPGFKIPDKIRSADINPNLILFLATSGDLKETFDDKMATVHTDILWPEDPAKKCLRLSCALTKETQNYRSLARHWEKNANDALNAFMQKFDVKKVDIVQACWTEVLEDIRKSSLHSNNLVQICQDDNSCTLEIVGIRDAVDDVCKAVEKITRKVNEIHERKSQIATEKITTLPEQKLKVLNATRFPNQMKQKFKDMAMFIDLKKGVTITALPNDIRDAKIAMYECLNKMVSHPFTPSFAVVELLKTKEIQNYLVRKFKEQNIVAVWTVEVDGVIVSALNNNDALTSISIIKKEIASYPVEVSKSSVPVVQGKKWLALVSDLQNEYKGCLHVSNYSEGKVFVTTTTENGNNIIEILKNFIRTSTILKNFLEVDVGIMRFLKTYKAKEIEKIGKERQSLSVKITFVENSKPGILVEGTADGLETAAREVNKLVKSVVTSEHVINMPGMARIFKEKEGQEYLDLLEAKHKCMIETEKGADSQEDGQQGPTGGSKKIQAHTICSNGAKIMVMKGDMTSHGSDVIVNAANGQLQHIGGLAKAIVDKGGKEIQDECNRLTRSVGDLLEGHVAATASGSLPCKKIIHAVGPVWRGGRSGETDILYETISNALEEMERLGLASIAFPAISSGVFGFPVQKSTDTIVEAVADYFQQQTQSAIQEVHLLDLNDSTVDSFCKSLVKKFGEASVAVEKNSRSQSSSVQMPYTSKPRIKPKPSVRPRVSEVRPPSEERQKFQSINSNCVKTEHGICITLKKTAIASENVDVIVNTTGKDLNLNAGAVSSSLNAAAGPGMQAECTQNIPASGYKSGEVVVTGGYNLQCQKVCHGSCLNWDNGAGGAEKVLRKYILNCLRTANVGGFSSIAFPAIGTGNLHIPANVVAEVMFDEMYKFGKNNPQSSLNDVRIILYIKDKTTIQGFEQHIKKVLSSKAKAGGRFQAEENNSEFTFIYPEETYGSDDTVFHSFSSQKNLHEIMVGNLTVQMQQSDITKERTDAIVNSTNQDLDFSMGAVSVAIAKAAGDDMLQECETLGAITDKVAVTSAGYLPCRHIIHMVAPATNSHMREWQKVIRSVLKEADQRKFQSITFPALGTGQIKASASDIAEAMYDAFGYFVEHDKPKHLKLIRIAVFQSTMIADFKKMMKAKEGKSYKQKGFGEKFKELLGLKSKADTVYNENKKTYHKGETVSLTLYIYASSEKCITDLKQTIDDYCKKRMHSEVISDEWKDMIHKLTEREISEILSLDATNLVQITVEVKLKRISIKGQTKDVMTLKDKIVNFLRKKQDTIRKAEDEKALYNVTHWQYEDQSKDGEFASYPASINAVIEDAFKKKQSYALFESDEGKHKVDFKKMEELCGPNSCKVHRKDLTKKDSVELPASWSKMADKEDLKLVTLKSTDAEYQSVLKSCNVTASIQIIKIQRVQNPGLYQRYQAYKCQIEKVNKPGTQNERSLWHGTAGPIQNINRRGFDRGFHGANGTAYGKGVYFAVNASYSVNYATANTQGHRSLYFCKVLTGEYTRGSSTYIAPPAKDPNDPSKLFDSVVDNINNPQMYVVFQDSQAYPEYLITF